jgi:hypothetical protein
MGGPLCFALSGSGPLSLHTRPECLGWYPAYDRFGRKAAVRWTAPLSTGQVGCRLFERDVRAGEGARLDCFRGFRAYFLAASRSAGVALRGGPCEVERRERTGRQCARERHRRLFAQQHA